MSNSITVKTQHRTLRAVYNTQKSYEELSVKKKIDLQNLQLFMVGVYKCTI